MLLGNLGSRCKEFESALTLYDFCFGPVVGGDYEDLHKRSGWLHIAARAAASAIYLFHEDFEFIGKNLTHCPTLGGMIDHKARRAATKKFSQYFPGFAGVRHSGQHHAKLYGTPEKMAENAVGPIIITSAIVNRTLQASFEKRTVQLDITSETLAKLEDVRNSYWAVFRPIDPR
jgi:hypothetical protein